MTNFESEDKIKNINLIYNYILKIMIKKDVFTFDEIYNSVKHLLKEDNMTEEKLEEMIENVIYFLQKYQVYVEQNNKFIKRSKATIKEKVTIMF